MTVRRIAFAGDSIVHGGSPATLSLIGAGGKGTFAELLADRLSNIPGIGPLMSAGFRSVWMIAGNGGSTEWSVTGAWSTTASTDAFDRGPYGGGRYSAGGTGLVLTWTRPSQWRPVVGFCLHFADYAAGGNWSYRVDGGTWTAMGQTLAHDNLHAKFYVPTAVTSTVEVRAANAAGTAVGACIFGIEPFYLDPLTVTDGFILDNLGRDGAPLDDLVLATSGDRMAWFDAVKVDPVNGGGAISNRPNTAILMMHVNDVRLFADTTKWATDIATLYTRVSPLAPLGYLSYWEMQAPTYDATVQANYRAQTKTSAALHAIPVKDFYDDAIGNGWGTTVGTQNAALVTAGLITVSASPVDNGHPTQAGHFDLADRTYWWVRTQLFNIGAVANPFIVGQSAVGGTDTLGGTGYLILGSRAAETDLANAGTKVVTIVGARASETDAANVGIPAVTVAGSRASEIDTGTVGSTVITVLGARATETDTGNVGTPAATVAGARASETDTANVGTPAAISAGSRAAETDLANAGTPATVSVGAQATETDTANPGSAGQAITGARATETDTANAGTLALTEPGIQAAELDAANAGTTTIVLAGAQSTETDTGTTGTPAATIAGIRSLEADTANAGQAGGAGFIVGNEAVESDTANAGTVLAVLPGARSSETDLANGGGTSLAVPGTRGTETDTANAGALDVTVTIAGARANETDLPNAGTIRLVIPGGQVLEVDVGFIGVLIAVTLGGRAIEIDLARGGVAIGGVQRDIDWRTELLNSGWSTRSAGGWEAHAAPTS